VRITPADADVKRVLDELQTHPEFALSHREIGKYIITPPGRRSDDVQTLLRLDQIEKVRRAFTTFRMYGSKVRFFSVHHPFRRSSVVSVLGERRSRPPAPSAAAPGTLECAILGLPVLRLCGRVVGVRSGFDRS
jgi:hypothetical protein